MMTTPPVASGEAEVSRRVIGDVVRPTMVPGTRETSSAVGAGTAGGGFGGVNHGDCGLR